MPLPSPSEQRKLAEADPELQALMADPNVKNISKVDWSDPLRGILTLRPVLEQFANTPTDPRVREYGRTYTTRDGMSQQLVIYTPAAATIALPVIVWYHGGGGCTGVPGMSAAFCRETALTQNCTIICPQYRLAPENEFPTGMDDCWDATVHIAEEAASYNGDPSLGFILAGESYGTTMAAVLMLRARDENLQPPVTGAFLSCGSYIPPHAVPPQYKEHYISRLDPICLAAPGLSEEAKAAYDWALQPDYDSPMYRAILWPTGHARLPRTYFQTCGMDINRDDTLIYRDVLEQNGVETKLDAYAGAPHCFWWQFPDSRKTQVWKDDTQRAFEWLFRKVQ